MAMDEALALHVPPGEGTLRIYQWDRPTLSFGRHQAVQGQYDPADLQQKGVEAVRRPTGGREVLHDREMTYAVVMRHGGPGFARGVYREVNEALVQALRTLGFEVEMARISSGRVPLDAGPCFQLPADGEIMAGGRKLVGSSQARIGPVLLQHGSLLLEPSPISVTSLPGRPPLADGETQGITLAELTRGRSAVTFASTAAAVETTFAERWAWGAGNWERGQTRPEERAAAEKRLEHYADPGWTWSR